MANEGPDFYDQSDVFGWYRAKRDRPQNANNTLEKPVFDDLAGELSGLRILDLGCGDGRFGQEALQKSAGAFTGLEASQNMFRAAQSRLAGANVTLIHTTIQDWDFPAQQFDLVASRLVLHYLQELAPTFANVYRSLVPGGRFIFSIEHPVMTCCDRARQPNTLRQDWIVDDYFTTGPRVVSWMGSEVIKHHRTVEDYFQALINAGFGVEALRESRPRRERFADEETYLRRLRIPLMLFFSARRAAG